MDKNIHVPISREDAEGLRAGDYVYLTGTIYTARDAAHKRMKETLDRRKGASPFPGTECDLLYGTVSGQGGPSHWLCRPYDRQQDG